MLEINKVYNLDCLEGIKQIDKDSIDFCICDYPFNVQDGRAKNQYVEFINNLSKEIYRVLKENSVLIIINNPSNIYKTRNCYNQFTYRDSIALIRKGALRPAWHFGFQHNYLMTFVKGNDIRKKWNGTKQNNDKDFLTDVIEYQNGFRGKGNMWHAQAIPLDFTEKFIELFTDENDLILDPFMGSGTTAVACKELKRNYIGFEFKEKYCEMIQQRLENFDKLHSSETIE